jgi:hypothetical protein
MTLYHYWWDPTSPTPLRPRASVKAPHVCMDHQHAQKWLGARQFDVKHSLLEHTTLGAINPAS